MRFPRLGVVGLLLLGACSDSNAAARARDGQLVLEVGGNQASLRQALTRAGLQPAPAKSVRAVAPAGHVDGGDAPAPVVPGAEPSPRDKPAAAPETPVAPPSSPAAEEPFFVVSLGEGQNLIQLARKHLGDANRVREIIALNGWSEAETRRLRPGQKVKIPRSTAPRATR